MDSNWKTETIQKTLDRLTKPHAYKIPHSPVVVVSKSMYDKLKACVTIQPGQEVILEPGETIQGANVDSDTNEGTSNE
jgi:hypothetical protein